MPIANAGELVFEQNASQNSVAKQSSDSETHDIQPPIIERHEPTQDHESLEQIAGIFQQEISPLVAIESLDKKPWADYPRHQCESLFCDITGVTHLFGDEAGLLKVAQELLASKGLIARMAIADSPGAAWALAHYLDFMPSFEASSENAFISPLGDSCNSLKPLPIESLRIWPETVRTLARLGVERVSELLQLPRRGLTARLGINLVHRIEQALGEVDEPMGVYQAPAEHIETLLLEYPTSDQKILEDRIGRLIEKVRAGLATRQRGALRLTCRLDLSAHPPLTLNLGLFAPTIDAEHLSGLMTNQLETKKLPSCVQRVTISVTLSGPLRTSQPSLFDAGNSETSFDHTFSIDNMSGSAISRLVDSLSGRLGREAVVGIAIQDDPLPEKAFSVSPLAGNRISSGKSRSFAKSRRPNLASSSSFSSRYSVQSFSSPPAYRPSSEDALRRPMSLLLEPIPLAVAIESGSFCLHVSSPRLPARIRLGGVVHQVSRHWGPERIETNWWKGPSIGRDYYRIEIDQAQWWWVFRNLVSKTRTPESSCRYRWMLHGHFA